MTEDLRLTGLRYNIITALFFVRIYLVYTAELIFGHKIPFCLVEVPSYVLLFIAQCSLPRQYFQKYLTQSV